MNEHLALKVGLIGAGIQHSSSPSMHVDEGKALGLSISYDIVTQQHGGSIEVESEPGQYTEFTVRLPRARRAAASAGGA